MNVAESLPRPIKEIETEWITLSDGCRLAARIWLPLDADTLPAPVILEYIPYRRRDYTRLRNSQMHGYYAGHGYAAVRVDIRGAGDSDGLLHDEYLQRELDDGCEVIAWLAEQPWCSGAVGMMGISWGGFNALQVAALKPPALKAIITVASTDDRYADDIHYMGGCLICENLMWGSTMFGFNSRPPDPLVVGDRWKDMWLARLEDDEPWVIEWLSHQRRDDFWRHGSVCEDYSAIEAAVYAVGGWADGYTNAISRLLAGLECPSKGLIGPWSHIYPHESGPPGPHIGFLHDSLRWWDHWLKGEANGVMDEPRLRAWMQESVAPKPQYKERPGRWVAEESWPSPRSVPLRYFLSPNGLCEEEAEEVGLVCRSPQTLGQSVGDWCPHGNNSEMPTDQRVEDGQCLSFDTPALESRVEILGAPTLQLVLSVDRRVAFVCVRLNDVAPDGASTRVTYGLLNLTHQQGHDKVVPVEPDERRSVRVQLNDIAHAFEPGHRIRVAVSTSFWPLVWPSPEPVTLTLFTGLSSLELPGRPTRDGDDTLRELGEPEVLPVAPHRLQAAAHRGRFVEMDVASGEVVLRAIRDRGRIYLEDIDLGISARMVTDMKLVGEDPLSAINTTHSTITMEREGWRIRTESNTVLSCTIDHFIVSATLDAFEDDTRVFSKTWHRTIERDGI